MNDCASECSRQQIPGRWPWHAELSACSDDVDKTMIVEPSSLENKASSAWLKSSCVPLRSLWHHEHITSPPWSTTIIDSWATKARGHWVWYYHALFWDSITFTYRMEDASLRLYSRLVQSERARIDALPQNGSWCWSVCACHWSQPQDKWMVLSAVIAGLYLSCASNHTRHWM
jgi:hypothetical protein